MFNKPHTLQLQKLGACDEILDWAESYNSMAAAWAACERPDYLLYLLLCSGAFPDGPEGQKALLLIVREFAENALLEVTKTFPHDERPVTAMEAVRACIESPGEVSYSAAYRARGAAWEAVYEANGVSPAAAVAPRVIACAVSFASVDYFEWQNAGWIMPVVRRTPVAVNEVPKPDKFNCDIIRKHYPTPPAF